MIYSLVPHGRRAYCDEDGNFYFVDRIGDVIRRRRANISSMQIQNVATGLGTVSQAGAVPVPAPEGGEDEIALAYELVQGADLDEAALRPELEAELPNFMVPKHLLAFDRIPTTGTNKMRKFQIRETVLDELD